MNKRKTSCVKAKAEPGFLTVVPVKVTGGDCQEMLKLELLVGVKLVDAEPAELLVLLDGMDTGAVAWRQRSKVTILNFYFNSAYWNTFIYFSIC